MVDGDNYDYYDDGNENNDKGTGQKYNDDNDGRRR